MKKIVLAILLVVLCLPLLATSAQSSTTTITITEADLNSRVRVQNPNRQNISNVVIDIQENQVAISATINLRRAGNVTGVVTIVPNLVTTGTRTRLEWDIKAFTINGQAGSGQYISSRNAISTAYRTAIEAKLGSNFSIQAVNVGADVITITGTQ